MTENLSKDWPGSKVIKICVAPALPAKARSFNHDMQTLVRAEASRRLRRAMLDAGDIFEEALSEEDGRSPTSNVIEKQFDSNGLFILQGPAHLLRKVLDRYEDQIQIAHPDYQIVAKDTGNEGWVPPGTPVAPGLNAS